MKKKPVKSPDKSTRPPLERMLRIHRAIQSGSHPNASGLAVDFEVSSKTIQRDIEFMRDRLDLPIDFDRAHNGYYYTEEVTAFPAMQITEGELFALVVAEKALEQYRGTHFEKPLLSAIKKVAGALPEPISIQFDDLEQSISFRTRAEPILDLGIFRVLARAVTHRQQLRLRYCKPGAAQPEERLVDPYHLGNINGEWYLFAFDHLRKDLRTFVPMRIAAAAPTGRTFLRPKKFSLDERLRDSFGVIHGSGSYDVRLRFQPSVAHLIREKRWHDSETVSSLPNGGVELRLRLSSLTEVERWILSWGGNCQVSHPPELADSVRRQAEKILGLGKS